MNVKIIRTNGKEENHEIEKRSAMNRIGILIGADCFDTVNLRDGRVMIVDDTGMIDRKPVNPEATKLYHSVCRPGTPNPICGDVAVCIDADFE